MRSNTKLTKYQKNILIAMKDEMSNVALVDNGETTIAFQEKGNTVEFALSVMSPEEKKFRRKVGQYWAYDRFHMGETVKMGREDFHRMLADIFYIWI